MRIGRLRHRITITLRSDVPNAFHGIDQVDSEPVSTWALVESVSGLNLRNGQQIAEGVTHKVTVRYRSDLSGDREITWDSVRLRIRSLIQDPRRRYTIAECEQVTP
ncbi:MAG: phage head closure protein [Gammaproteobacteria bacterium]|nr:phage head closure protein [Gammaproteobacteria bacterium]